MTLTQDDATYHLTLNRLSKASVDKHWEPYRDIAWDDPDLAVDPVDPRWILPAVDPLGSHPWYLAQPRELQARIGLYRQAHVAKVGMQFENILNRGILAFGLRLPNDSAEFRYVYHEMIEECHHGMMFQEFVNRSGTDVTGMTWLARWFGELAQLCSVFAPTLYFLGVLAGEEPIDYMQRRILRDAAPGHPLLNKIMSIHVAEEARHISFGRQYVLHHVPQMAGPARFVMSLAVPPTVKLLAGVILTPPAAMGRVFDIPKDVVVHAYWGAEESKDVMVEAVSNVRRLCTQVGLINPVSERIWRVLGIWG